MRQTVSPTRRGGRLILFHSRFRTSSLLRNTLLASAPAIFAFGANDANAACVFAPPAGNDSYVCDSDTSVGGLNDPGGDNTLQVTGTGTISGNVVFGAGVDGITIDAGTIQGTVNQGAGSDSFVISGGIVTGNVQQASGTDSFTMSGGQIQSLSQGDNFDVFRMSDGHIVGFFEDGDEAYMSGGRIGRVDMKLDDNLFDMSGGQIDGNLVAGFGNDTIILSNGRIGGNISVSGGADRVTVTGGEVGGNVLLSFGNDTFTWDGGGTIAGFVDLAAGDDTAALRGLGDAEIGGTVRVDGGVGVDEITFDDVTASNMTRFPGWETFTARNNTELTLADVLTLGDAGTGTGVFSLDASSTIFAEGTNGGITSLDPAALASVTNAGTIDLTSGGAAASDRFTIGSNYTGDNAVLRLQTEFGDDSSPSDQLRIERGTATGNTTIVVTNVGGEGAATTGDGIRIVDAAEGATTLPTAFALSGAIAVGAYEYLLFRGGTTDGSEESWFLRSSIVPSVTGDPLPPAPPPDPETPPPPPPPLPPDPETPPPPFIPPVAIPIPTPDTPPPTPDATPVVIPPTPPAPGLPPVPAAIPLYRVETPLYAAVPPLAHHIGLTTLGTFHERRGEQAFLNSDGFASGGWGRVFGQSAQMKWAGDVAPSFDGSLFGIQAGLDLFGRETASGALQQAGLFFSYARASGDILGQAMGWNDLAVGTAEMSGTGVGGYVSHVGPNGWYVEGVLAATWYGGGVQSVRGLGIETNGHGIAASVETGYPVVIADGWTIEPQAQLIWQRVWLDDSADAAAPISFASDGAVTGRIGVHLSGSFGNAIPIEPYLKANLWHTFDANETIFMGANPIVTNLEQTTLELGGGISAKLSDNAKIFAAADYTMNLGGEKVRVFEGNVGLTVSW